MKTLRTLGFVTFASALLPLSVNAASLDAATLLKTINGIVLNDIQSSTSHFEGTGYVGNDINNANGWYAGSDPMPDYMLDSLTGALIVGNDINSNLNNPGNRDYLYGGNLNGSVSGSGTVTSVNQADIPISEMKVLFDTLAMDLSTLSNTAGAGININDNNLKALISGTGGPDHVAIYNLSESEANTLFTGGTISQINLEPDVSYILNVPGSGYNLTVNNNIASSKVLFNFFEATLLSIGGGNWQQSILAPKSTFTLGASGMNGSLVVNDLIQTSELRPFNDTMGYDGKLPTNQVPLPAGIVLLGSGAGVLAAMRFRRRKEA